jgi:ABC-type glycerol-3-phosphate transport system permease component
MTTIVLAMVPVMILYPFLQRHFAKGILIGAVKE